MAEDKRAICMCAANFFINSLISTVIVVLSVDIMNDIGLPRVVLGIVFAMSGIVTSIVTTLPGIITDKIGARNGLILTFFLQWIPLTLMALVDSPSLFVILSIIAGFGDSFKIVTTSAIIQGLKIKNHSAVFGITSVGRSLGSIVCEITAVGIAHQMIGRWRGTMLLFSGISLIIGVSCIILIWPIKFERPIQHCDRLKKEKLHSNLFKLEFVPQRDRKKTWAIMLFAAGVSGFFVVLSFWLPTMMSDRGVSPNISSYIKAVNTIGSLTAALLIPRLLVKWIGKTSVALKVCTCLIGICFIIMFLPITPYVVVAVFFSGVIGTLLTLQYQYHMIEAAPAAVQGKYVAMINSVSNLSGTIAIIGMGLLNSSGEQLVFLCFFVSVGIIGIWALRWLEQRGTTVCKNS